jgi:hypothetical protein
MINTHNVKIWQRPYEAIERGDKTFDVRRNDRNYQVGDILILEEFRHAVGEYTGRKIVRLITYVMQSTDTLTDNPVAEAIAPGYCVLGLKIRTG